MVNGTIIWKTNTKRWNFASSVVFPLADTNVTANIILGNRVGQAEDSLFSQYDMIFVPLVASYHISQLEHVAFNVTVWAPTGDYEQGRLANNGMNVWTFIPTITYTRICHNPVCLLMQTTELVSTQRIRTLITRAARYPIWI